MAEFFFDYGLFALKTLTLLGSLAVIALIIGMFVGRSSGHAEDHLKVVRINERLEREQEALSTALMDDQTFHLNQKEKHTREKRERKAKLKAHKKALKLAKKTGAPLPTLGSSATDSDPEVKRARVFVLDFDGDIAATALGALRRELTAILSVASDSDEIVVRLESGGGMVHAYGLAASQLTRVRKKGVKLTICVDKIAASGGYMMACVGDKLLAAPFAVIGSIGVVAQMPNFHKILKKNDVDFELLTAGEHKRTLTVLGENTEAGRKKFQEELDITHALFKDFIKEQRPSVDVDAVATGEVWLGTKALGQNLVDELMTSDEYLSDACVRADVLEVRFEKRKSFQDRLASSLEASALRVLGRIWQKATHPSALS